MGIRLHFRLKLGLNSATSAGVALWNMTFVRLATVLTAIQYSFNPYLGYLGLRTYVLPYLSANRRYLSSANTF
jgi:NO-binding membrane sensor protein with MHYT domain